MLTNSQVAWLCLATGGAAAAAGLYLSAAARHQRQRSTTLAAVLRARAHISHERIGSATGEEYSRLLHAGLLLHRAEDLCTRTPDLGEPLLGTARLTPTGPEGPLVEAAEGLLQKEERPATGAVPPRDSPPLRTWGLALIALAAGIGALLLRSSLAELANSSTTLTMVTGALNRLWEVQGHAFITFGGCLAYLCLFLATRWHLIVRPARAELRTKIETAIERSWIDHDQPAALDVRERLVLYHATLLFEAARQRIERTSGIDVLFWSRGQEHASLSLYKAATSMLLELWPEPRLEKTLPIYLRELREVGLEPVAAQIETEMGGTTARRVLASRALEELGSARVHRFGALQERYGKAMWALMLAIGGVVAASGMGLLSSAGATGFPTLDERVMACGAIGGTISRIYRLNTTSSVTGADPDWGVLFLSPVVGALAAWIGVLWFDQFGAIGLLGDWSKILGASQDLLQLGALSVLLGFSETLLISTANQLTRRLERGSQEGAPPSPSGGTSGVGAGIDAGGRPPGGALEPPR